MSLRFKLFALACVGLLLPLVVLGWSRLRLETDILTSLPGDLPEVQALRLLRDGFEGGSDLLVTVEAVDARVTADAVEAVGQRLRGLPELAQAVAWQETLDGPLSTAADLVAWLIAHSPSETLASLKTRLEGEAARQQLEKALRVASSSPDIEQVQRAGYDPFGLLDGIDLKAMGDWQPGLLRQASEDGRLRLLVVTPAKELAGYQEAEAWLDQIRREVAVICAERPVTVRYTGEPAFQAEIGAGIEKDMSSTLGLTELLIALLFWGLFRCLKPLLWIQLLLVLTLAITVGLGGLLVGQLSIMSLGFAAIVLGIVVDYAVLILQEGRAHPGLDASALRRRAAPGIAAGAGATAVVFVSLSFGGLPGLAELGLLVSLGVLTGLAVMLLFAPTFSTGVSMPPASARLVDEAAWRRVGPGAFPGLGATVGLGAGCVAILGLLGPPTVDTSSKALRPIRSESMAALDALQARLHQQDQLSLPLVVTGQLADLRTRAERTAAVLEQAVHSGSVLAFTLPTLLAPQPSVQRTNEPVLKWLVAEQVRLERLLEEMGFTAEAGALLRGVCAAWREGMSQDAASTGGGSGAVPASLRRFLRVEGLEPSATTGLAVGAGAMLGEVQIAWPEGDEAAGARAAETLRQALEPLPGVSLASWQTLGARLTAQVRSGLTRQLWPVLALILVTLLVTFRSVKDTLLALAMLLLGLGGLVATMRLTGQTWNLANLASIPLLLGTGIDYGIHMLLALQRSGNQVAHVRRTTGRAVFFSGMTTVIGFGSLGLAGNRGIASLGWVCAVGSLWILLVVLWLLPCWRVWTCRRASNREET